MIVEQVTKTKFAIELNEFEEKVVTQICSNSGQDYDQELADIFTDAINNRYEIMIDKKNGENAG